MNDRFLTFTHDEWGALRASTPMTLTEDDLAKLRGINEQVSLDEVAQIYLPLSRLLNLYVAASQSLYQVTDTFLGKPAAKVPYIIGVAGSVAVGKSTTSRILQALLSRWPAHPQVDLITTDGFLHPNQELEMRGIMHRKGFPESYNLRRLLEFLAAVKSGEPAVAAPVYSHEAYDIVPGAETVVQQPDIVIVEGLNVLHAGGGADVFVSDFFDFSVYVDADEEDVRQWYIDRFTTLRATVFQDEAAYFHRYAGLSDDEARAVAFDIWETINGVNLRDHIVTTRDRAHLILEKEADHSIRRVRLRRL
ncbi:MAG: type I pantothenate kinase [Acidimicrobiia bacterium]|nr:type I pantothenate kinase [Acidimicrobiia bacterium]